MIGMGLTTIVKLMLFPAQLLVTGVTVISETMGLVVLLVPVNSSIVPSPVEGNPIIELLFVHWYLVPATDEPLNTMGPMVCPSQTRIGSIGKIEGVGWILYRNETGLEEHPLLKADTVMVLLIITLDILTEVKAAILLVPLKAAIPVKLLDAFQLYIVLGMEDPVKITALVICPAHKNWSGMD